jgi:hypothetical protein
MAYHCNSGRLLEFSIQAAFYAGSRSLGSLSELFGSGHPTSGPPDFIISQTPREMMQLIYFQYVAEFHAAEMMAYFDPA